MLVAIVRELGPEIAGCALTFREREPIDVDQAIAQHREYRSLLSRLGCEVVALPPSPTCPDGVFVEDTAVVLDELAVVARPALAKRRAELPSIEATLGRYRRLHRIEEPGFLEGGDVMRVGRRLFVGRSTRTNDEGIAQLRAIVGRHGYEVVAVELGKCLHLKSACSDLGHDTVLVQPRWIDPAVFTGLSRIQVPDDEEGGGNALRVAEDIVLPRAFHSTRARIEAAGFAVHSVDASELAKAEGGVTCTSLLLSA